MVEMDAAAAEKQIMTHFADTREERELGRGRGRDPLQLYFCPLTPFIIIIITTLIRI